MSPSYLIPAATFAGGALCGALALGGYRSLSDAVAPVSPSVDPEPVASEVSAPPPSVQTARSAETPPRPAADAQPDVELPAAATDDEIAIRLRGLASGWSRLEAEVARLNARVAQLERRLPAASTPAAQDDEAPPRARTPEDRRTALERAGIDSRRAEDIVWRQGQYELDQLDLRDQAVREGWIATERYREELMRLEEERVDLRAELGEEAFDRYLFAAGEENRLRIETLIPGSAAEGAGLLPGDLIETYDGGRVFGLGELRVATAEGERGESVAVTVRRADGSLVQAWLPRGPLGVHLRSVRARPDG